MSGDRSSLGDGSLLLLADHRPAPSCLPIYEVANLEATTQALRARGWQPKGASFEIPNGPCQAFADPSGNPFALFEDIRPGAMESAYADPANRHAIRNQVEELRRSLMKLGLQVGAFNWPGSPVNTGRKLLDIARTADEAGFASLWVMDHYFQIEQIGKASDPMLEAYTALSFMAGVTQRVRLGAMVTGVIYRQPAFLVKQVSTLDVLSGGRANLGIGAAWYEREAVGLGFPFPPMAERFERLEETLQIAKHLWSGNPAPFEGKHYQLPEPINSPQPLSQPHPPILIGGGGEKKTLRFVATYGDACNLFAFGGLDQLRHKLDVLKGHCDAVGRDHAEIERTALGMAMLGPGGMSPTDLISFCRGLASIGVQQYIISIPNVHEIEPLKLIGREVIEAIAEL